MPKSIKKKSVRKPKTTKKVEKKAKTTRVVLTKSTKVVSPKVEEVEHSMSVPVLMASGGKSEKMTLPRDIFGGKINKSLIVQAVRVYLTNQRKGLASTKTRGEVEGSTRKIYRQKGTGRARHGGIRAPIFVGGGITFGPKPRNYHLEFPKKMKKQALTSALADQHRDGNVSVIDGLGTLPPKTKSMSEALHAHEIKGNTLLVVSKNADNVRLGARNLNNIDIVSVDQLHTYAVIAHQKIIFMKESVMELTQKLNQKT